MNREELLRAMSEIDAKYIEEAAPPEDLAGQQPRQETGEVETLKSEALRQETKKVRSFRRILPLGGLVAACLVAVISISTMQNLQKNEETAPVTNTVPATTDLQADQEENQQEDQQADQEIQVPAASAQRQDDQDAQENTMIANPFIEYESLEAMVEATGIELTVPEAIDPYTELSYDAIQDDFVEVIYYDKDANEGYRIRKGIGDEDISGDYNEYAVTEQVDVDGRDVTLKGDGETVRTAIWTVDGSTYAVDADEYAFTKEKMMELISEIM